MKSNRFKVLTAIAVVAVSLLAGCVYESAPVTKPPPNRGPNSGVASSANPNSGIVTVCIFAVGEALSVFVDAGDTEVLIDGGNDGGRLDDGGTVADAIWGGH